MSQENVETFKRGLDAYHRRDVEAMLENADAEIEWQPVALTALGGDAAVYRGHEEIREGFRDLFETLGEIRLEYTEIRDLGDCIVGIGRIHARGEESEAETESPHATVVEYRNGMAIRVRSYLDPKEALEAAGLSE
jgi:ketosteroid isomerase-like protein